MYHYMICKFHMENDIVNILNYILIISGFLKNFIPDIDEFLFTNLISSILGGIVGYGMIWLIIKLYKKLIPILNRK